MKLPFGLPAMTVRARLTALYAGLFLLAGLALVALSYVLVAQRIQQPSAKNVQLIQRISNVPVKMQGVFPDPRDVAFKVLQAQEEFRQETLNSLLTQSAFALALVAIAATGLGWVVAGRVLRPIHQITATARRVADRSLHERIALRGPKDELTELADTFDEMLERLDRAFDGQRRFAGNAAHELRTPLTINRTLLEVALTRPDASEDLRRLGQTLLVVNERHERLIEGLLLLARAEATVANPVAIDLAEVATHVAEQVELIESELDPEVRLDLRPAQITGDPLLLERVVRNLLDNAVTYNRTGGWVELSTGVADDGQAELTVVNTGPGVASYEIPGLFEPFRRGTERVRSDRGVGLGLSIASSIVRAHGGRMHAEPREGGGLIMRVTLPS